jgi:hypothetical protein
VAAHVEVFEKMAALLSDKQQMAILGRRKTEWEIVFKTGQGWDFSPGSLRQRVVKEAEDSSESILIMDSEKDDRFVDSKPPFRSALCIPILIPGRLPVMVFAEEPQKIQSFNFNKLPAWEEMVNQLRTLLPELKSPSAAKKAAPVAPAGPSLQEKLALAVNPEGEKVEINWPALIAVLLLLLGGGVYLVKAYLQSRDEDRLKLCRSNLATIATAARMYSRDNNGRFPKTLEQLKAAKYLELIPLCPASGSMTYSDYTTHTQPPAVTVSCVGGHHRKLFTGSGSAESFPYYSSLEVAEQAAKKAKRK